MRLFIAGHKMIGLRSSFDYLDLDIFQHLNTKVNKLSAIPELNLANVLADNGDTNNMSAHFLS
jgi:hypothetical protein